VASGDPSGPARSPGSLLFCRGKPGHPSVYPVFLWVRQPRPRVQPGLLRCPVPTGRVGGSRPARLWL